MSLCMCATSVHVHDDQQRASDLLEPKLQAVVSCLTWVLSTRSHLFSPRVVILTGLGLFRDRLSLVAQALSSRASCLA